MNYSILLSGLVVLTTIFSVSCLQKQVKQEQPDKIVVSIDNDMEKGPISLPSWGNEQTIVKMPSPSRAHSGMYVSKVDSNNIYSYTFYDLLHNLNNVTPYKVFVSGWFYIPEPIDELIVAIDISDKDQNIMWKRFSISQQINDLNKWTEFNAVFDIDQPIKIDQQVKIFAFASKKEAYFDDFKITFEY